MGITGAFSGLCEEPGLGTVLPVPGRGVDAAVVGARGVAAGVPTGVAGLDR